MRRDYGVTYEGDDLGSFDDGDPFTTNLYVGNLAPTVDEEVSSVSIARTACISQSFIGMPGVASVQPVCHEAVCRDCHTPCDGAYPAMFVLHRQ